MQPNTVAQAIPTGPDDFLAVRTIEMFTAIPYSIRVYPSAGLGSLRLYVFAPSSSGSGRFPRSAAALETVLTPDVENRIDYTPSQDGVFAIVIVNESGVV